MPLLLLEKNSFLYFHLYDLPFRLNIGIKMKNEVGKQFPLWDIPVLLRTRKNKITVRFSFITLSIIRVPFN